MITTLKVVFLGESGVGKSCIMKQFAEDIFDKNISTSFSAESISKTIILEELNQTIKFDIWVMAGTKRFRPLSNIFYKDADVICLCYDSTNKSSFEELKDFWYEKEIKNKIGHAPILVIVANKNDLNKEVKDVEGKAFSKEINAIFQSTSATSNIEIKNLFENIARKYFDPSYDCNEIEDREKKE